MAELFRFELVSPEKLVLAADVQQVLVPGSEGDMGILAGHAPVMTTIRPGLLEVTTRSGNSKRFYVRGGFAEADPERLTVLAQQSIDLEELNAAHLAQEIKDYEPRLALDGGTEGLDYYHRLLKEAPHFLHDSGLIILEVGEDQASKLAQIIPPEEIIKDYNDKERIVVFSKDYLITNQS